MINEPMNKLAFSVEEVAQLIPFSKSHIRNEIRDGHLKVKRIGRRVYILREDLDAYLRCELTDQRQAT